jgi:hypothetical protein
VDLVGVPVLLVQDCNQEVLEYLDKVILEEVHIHMQLVIVLLPVVVVLVLLVRVVNHRQ